MFQVVISNMHVPTVDYWTLSMASSVSVCVCSIFGLKYVSKSIDIEYEC
jgi:hypothetical protein